MRVRHPRALDGDPPQVAVDVEGVHVSPNEDGTYDIPDDADGWLDRYAAANDVDTAELLVEDGGSGGDTCQAVKSDGEVCGRETPCQYHSEED